ncbi:hypothetical protein [Anaerofustis sp.]|uniref:hypothetical protein n=1 Tax=Anaerofustis sp. TaxID=1872517 RepID=UPI0025B88151|nr:hypothetical protein [Anaerofustis sp.]
MIIEEQYKEFEKELKSLKSKKARLNVLKNYKNLSEHDKNELSKLQDEIEIFEKALESMNYILKNIIIKYYIEEEKLKNIADNIGYSFSYCSKKKKEAVKLLSYLINGKEI